jgi:hypothetical protein
VKVNNDMDVHIGYVSPSEREKNDAKKGGPAGSPQKRDYFFIGKVL